MEMTAFYGVLKNSGSEPIKLVGGKTEVAEKVTVMETVMAPDGVMRMRHVDYLEIPAGGTLVLKPMGDHVMIEGLKQPLGEGAELELTLTFDPSSELTGKYPVRLEAPEQ
jgi:copper(I)-binding protein